MSDQYERLMDIILGFEDRTVPLRIVQLEARILEASAKIEEIEAIRQLELQLGITANLRHEQDRLLAVRDALIQQREEG